MKTDRFASAYHRSTLVECLETEKPITKKSFNLLVSSRLYHFYVYDERLKCNRYILNDIGNNSGLPTWLHWYPKNL